MTEQTADIEERNVVAGAGREPEVPSSIECRHRSPTSWRPGSPTRTGRYPRVRKTRSGRRASTSASGNSSPSGWPPDGWYPVDFYRDDLTARDQLAATVTQLPSTVTGRFQWAIGRVDAEFKALTHETTTPPVSGGSAWWWQRAPEKPGLA